MIRLCMLGNNPMVTWGMEFPGTGLEAGKPLGGYCNSPGEGCCWHTPTGFTVIGVERSK